MKNFSEYVLTASCEIDPATLDENIDRKGMKRAMLVASGYSRVIHPKKGGESDSPRDSIAWTQRIGSKSLNDPKHVNNLDHAAIVAADGKAVFKVWW